MRGEPFPMSLWERAVLESLERIESALQRTPTLMTSGVREKKQDQTVPRKPSHLISLRVWAETNGIRLQHAYAMARQGQMPVVRLGRRVYVHLATIDTWVERGARSDDLVHFELSDGGSVTRLRDDLEGRL